MKTLKEFDYDLWATEENGQKRYFARVKATHEETEISLEVMRLLLSQEKQMRREYERQQIDGSTLSLDLICGTGDMDEAVWLADTKQNIDSDILCAEEKAAFCNTLTANQLSIFNECIIDGKSMVEYASDHGMTKQSVYDAIVLIRKKAKKYFG